MKTDLHEQVLKALGTFSEPATIENLTAELVMRYKCDLGAMPLRAVANSIDNAIRTGEDRCPILKVESGYILKDKDPDILLDFPKEKSIAQRNSEAKSGIITCFGYGWDRDLVFWCPRPKLLGYQYITPIDFSDQIGIYVLHTQDGKVQFVGCATDRSLGECIYEHSIDHLEEEWWKFSFFGFRPVADDGTFGQIPKDAKMADILPSVVKIVMEIDKPSSNIIYPDYHVSLCFIQCGKPISY